ncbi:MAG: molybdopterin molybdotransferase MoeA [Rhodobacteraceae bacterium]|nr:molybdopterin molybdotransferase MoeA [Paracoccaceae bacterium]
MATVTSPALQEPEPKISDGSTGLLPIDIAYQKGLALARTLVETETVGLMEATGRVCAGTHSSSIALPSFDNSAMDGFAVRTCDLIGAPPFTLPITARIVAGDDGALSPGTNKTSAVRIFTGAPIPDGYNAVVMQEYCVTTGTMVELDRLPIPGQNIRRRGEDCATGVPVLADGTLIDARSIALLSALGVASIEVRRRVRVAFFSTGTELRQPGEDLEPGQIYNSNRYMLASQLHAPHIELIDLGAVPDDPRQLEEVLTSASDQADVVITTGGVSVGDEDDMPRLLKAAGGEIHVMKVAIKPGKPLTVGTLRGAIYIGLPGNPVAAYVNTMLMARPIIDKLSGTSPRRPAGRKVIASFERQRRSRRQEYLPARIISTDSAGTSIVEGFSKAGSATLLPLVQADGFVVLPPDCAAVNSGDQLEFIPFS